MKTQKQMWKEINEPKLELKTSFDKNGKPTGVLRIVDRVPKKWTKWKTMRRRWK